MTKEDLKQKTKDEILGFIKDRLSIKTIDNQKIYEEEVKDSAQSNLNILNKFADLGIYENTMYLILEHKTLHLQYQGRQQQEVLDLSNFSTSEIIYKIFEKTIFLDKRSA